MSAGTLLTHPATPGFQAIRWFSRSAIARTRSPFSYVEQLYNWGGQMRGAEIELPPMSASTAKLWIAFFHDLNGPEGTFYLSDTIGVSARWGSGVVDNQTRECSAFASGTDRFSFATPHNMFNDTRVRLTTTDTLPPPFEADTNYYVIVVNSTTVELAATPGGATIDMLTGGAGTQSMTPYNVGDSVSMRSLDLSVVNYFAGEQISILDRIYTLRGDVTASSAGYALASVWPSVVSDPGASDIDAGTDTQGVFRLDEWPDYGWSVERLATGTKLIAMEVL